MRMFICRPPVRTLSASVARLAQHGRLVERQHLPLAHQHPSIHDRRPHVVAPRGVDQVRQRIVHRRLPGARASTTTMRSARLPGSSEPICAVHADRPRALDRRHARATSPAGSVRGSLRRELVQERRLAHRLEHVQVVVAGRAIGAEPDRHAGRAQRRHRRGAAGQLHVALGIVRHADLALRAGSAMSAGVRCTPCAASVRGPKKPSESRYATGVALCCSCGASALRPAVSAR